MDYLLPLIHPADTFSSTRGEGQVEGASQPKSTLEYSKAGQKPTDTDQKMKSSVDLGCEGDASRTAVIDPHLGLILSWCRLHVKRVCCIPVRKNFFIWSIAVWLALPVVGQVPAWGIGPFTRPVGINPIIVPSTNSLFECPMTKTSVEWEAGHTFNPAAVVKDGKVFVIYRAEDNSGAAMIGGHTSRLGLAESDDGLHFHRFAEPVLFPAEDGQKANEWPGGCEDPRLVEGEDGTFILLYTQWNRKIPQLATATSRDLVHWTKQGAALTNYVGPSKSGAIVCKISDDRLKAAKINGKYWMYWGEGIILCASSGDLIHWDAGLSGLPPRRGKFDSALAEAGPPAVLTDRGIVLLYNGKNDPDTGDASLPPNVYSDGQALFDANDPWHLLERTEHPFFQPEMPFERTGQYGGGTTFIEGLVWLHRKWFLYYGCADSFVGVAESGN